MDIKMDAMPDVNWKPVQESVTTLEQWIAAGKVHAVMIVGVSSDPTDDPIVTTVCDVGTPAGRRNLALMQGLCDVQRHMMLAQAVAYATGSAARDDQLRALADKMDQLFAPVFAELDPTKGH